LGVPLDGGSRSRRGQGDPIVDLIAGKRSERFSGLLGCSSNKNSGQRTSFGRHDVVETISRRQLNVDIVAQEFEGKR
jgi:hypothetical protein